MNWTLGIMFWAIVALGIAAVFLIRRMRPRPRFDPFTAGPCTHTCQGAGLPVCLEQGACQVVRLRRADTDAEIRARNGGW